VHEVIAWVFHSPRRLLVVVVAAIALLLLGALAVQATRPGAGRSGDGAASGVAAPVDAAPAVSAAVDFARRWASVPSGQAAEQWRAGLSGRVTPELAAGLALTDPATLPGGSPSGEPVIRFVSVSSALVEVPLSSGRPVLVTVVSSNGRWLASDVQPVEGNAGDVPVASPSGAGPSGAGSSGAGSSGSSAG
jgi:hypothetical protein